MRLIRPVILRSLCLAPVLCLAGVLFSFNLRADEHPATDAATAAADREAQELFDRKIRPLLAARCQECHGAEKQKGGLRVDSRATAVQGGDSGAAIVPGKPDESLLVQAIRYTGDIKMPPKSKLPDAEIDLLVEWVRKGAVWPATEPSPNPKPGQEKSGPLFTDEDRAFWAFQPVAVAPPPAVKDAAWPKSDIDRFILAELETKGLSPAPRADRRTLLRRVTLDLTGLPPTPEEVAVFVADDSPDAFARVVDRLLASPRYGERWGRHWLDVARYADSNGLDENLAHANAFRYRDYVIAAFNNDKPFDRFLHEQLAGDLLPETGRFADTLEAITATGFLSLGGKMLAEDDPVKMQMDIIDEQVDTIGRAFLGLTLGCARCHAHKYDPIPQEDYYSLAGIFKSTKTMENFKVVARWQEVPLAEPQIVRARDAHQQQITGKQAEIKRLTEEANGSLLKEARGHVGDYLLAAAAQRQLDEIISRAKPIGDAADARERAGAIVIEAEDFIRGNVLKDRDNYGKEIGVLVNAGELPNFVEYEVPSETGGLHQVDIRYAAASRRPSKLSINGRTVNEDACGKMTGTWFPDSQAWFVEGFFPLKAGKNIVRLENGGPFPHIDKLLFAPARNATGEPLTLPEAPDRTPDAYAPKSAFVQQWSAYLDRTRNDPASLFTVWHEMESASPPLRKGGPGGGAPPQEPDSPSPPTSEDALAVSRTLRELLLADPKPTNLAQLAARYDALFVEAQNAGESRADGGEKDKHARGLVLEALRKLLHDDKGPFALPKNIEEHYSATTLAELKAKRDEQKALEQSLPKLPEAMAVSEGKPENLRVHLRGSHLALGEETPRRFPRILAGDQAPSLGEGESGRRQLAEWLTSPGNPLTSRVIANRVWLWHFGEGLVRSPDNFGRLGERPTHPQLLDYLAAELVRGGWSLKALHRLILLSSTYQMSTTFDERAAGLDPENRLWWRMNRRRMEAEAIRDSMLAVAGTLDVTMGGSLLPTPNRSYVTSTASVNPDIYNAVRRSVYLPVVRSALYEVFQAFDFADPSVLMGKRDSTTVAPQALFMLNSRFVLEQSKALAANLLADDRLDDAGRIARLYETALSRPANEQETQRGLEFLARYTRAAAEKQPAEVVPLRAWQALCRTILASNEFVYVE